VSIGSNGKRSNGGPELDAGIALSVQELSKQHTVVHLLRNTPTSSVFARLRDRGDPIFGGQTGGAFDLDDDEDEDEFEERPPEPGEVVDWPLREVSFEVARGEVVGVVGRPAAGPQTLARILGGMTSPSAGRIVARGRIGPSVELAALLTRRETHPRRVAKTLARVLGVGRSRRREYVEQVLRLAAGDGPAGPSPVSERQRMRHVVLAAALDPYADVLVLDEVPTAADAAFHERFTERLELLLRQGAAAVVTSGDLELILRLCSRAVLLEHGEVVREGPVAEVIEAVGQTSGAQPAARPRRVGFDARAALLAVETTDESGERKRSFRPYDEPRVLIQFETAEPRLTVTCRVKLIADGARTFSTDGDLIAEPGRYIAVLRIPAGSVPDGDYQVTVDLFVVHEGQRSTIGRQNVVQMAFEGFGDDGGTLADEIGAPVGSTRSAAEADWTIEPDAD